MLSRFASAASRHHVQRRLHLRPLSPPTAPIGQRLHTLQPQIIIRRQPRALSSPWALNTPAQGAGSSAVSRNTAPAVPSSTAARPDLPPTPPSAPTCAPHLQLPLYTVPQPTSTSSQAESHVLQDLGKLDVILPGLKDLVQKHLVAYSPEFLKNEKKGDNEEDRRRPVARKFSNSLQAFCIYANILTEKHPEIAPGLFKYVDMILEAYKNIDLWMGMLLPKPQPPQFVNKMQLANKKVKNSRIKLTTPVKVEKIVPFLKLYPNQQKAQLIFEGFSNGFWIPSDDDKFMPIIFDNLKSAKEHPDVGLVPKKEPWMFRLIHHLSYPHGLSINDGIDPELYRYLHALGTSSRGNRNQLPNSPMRIDLGNLKTTISNSVAKKSWSSYVNSWSSRHVIVNSNNSEIDNLIHLLAQMQSQGKSPNTMKKHIAGISFFLKLFDRPDITKKPIVKQLLKGFHKAKPTADKRKPITLAILLQLVHNLRQMYTSEYECAMFKLLYLVSFFGALRVGETVSSSKVIPVGLNVNDVGLKNDRLQMVIRQILKAKSWLRIGSATQLALYGAKDEEIKKHDLLAMLSQMISRWGQPDIVLIHLSGNDIGKEKTIEIIRFIRRDLAQLHFSFPKVVFVWSEIVSRITWFPFPEIKSLDRCQKKINSAIAKFAKGLNIFTYRHTDLELNGSGVYRDDGVHLSDIGLDIFNNGLKNAIELAICKWKGAKAGR
ncbi:hypothetical protein XELAEV_18014927mg [Xenopus laevis]|uniref:SGNH hydrolase-type esterase domain-containing protein n=1 Tax=Xenopus laevis TaxID=8355 RepID=A0A974DI59_XENLA|nr:hypothetical protein XELAEV_18014927mg [Xenopus laevis]